MIDVENLAKYYGNTRSLDGLTFHLPEGEVMGLLGPNGAGKTTTMRILTGLTRASAGRATVAGYSAASDHRQIRRMLGYLPEEAPLYHEMRAEQYLRFMAGMKDLPRRTVESEVTRVLQEVRLDGVRQRIVGNLSKGNRQRLGLAQALLGNPKLLILDEPTVGLDPSQIATTLELIRSMKGRRTVIFSTHILSHVATCCTRVVIIKQGRTMANGSVQDVQRALGGLKLRLVVRGDRRTGLKAMLEPVVGAVLDAVEPALEVGNTVIAFHPPEGDDVRPAIVRACVAAEMDVLELTETQPSLEDVFLSVTSDTPEAAS